MKLFSIEEEAPIKDGDEPAAPSHPAAAPQAWGEASQTVSASPRELKISPDYGGQISATCTKRIQFKPAACYKNTFCDFCSEHISSHSTQSENENTVTTWQWLKEVSSASVTDLLYIFQCSFNVPWFSIISSTVSRTTSNSPRCSYTVCGSDTRSQRCKTFPFVNNTTLSPYVWNDVY